MIGSILVAGTNGINISGAGINVTISGLEVEGLGNTAAPGLSGVKIFQAASISNTRVIGQSGTGLAVNTAGGSGATLTVSAANSVFSGNTSGVIAKTTAGTGSVNLTVVHLTITNNSLVGVQLNGAAVTAQLSGNTITGNTTGLALQNMPSVTTFGDNILRQNGTNGTFPAAPVAKQQPARRPPSRLERRPGPKWPGRFAWAAGNATGPFRTKDYRKPGKMSKERVNTGGNSALRKMGI